MPDDDQDGTPDRDYRFLLPPPPCYSSVAFTQERVGFISADSGLAQDRGQAGVTMTGAEHLHAVHALAPWLLRVLGLRVSEGYGIHVRDVYDDGDYGVIRIFRQGGRNFTVLDEFGDEERVPSKKGLKTAGSDRYLIAPPQVMVLIRFIIETFHTDPVTGEADPDARLIPALSRPNRAGQSAFRPALASAAAKAGIDLGDDQEAALLPMPKDLRAGALTDLQWEDVPDAIRLRWGGHLGRVSNRLVRSERPPNHAWWRCPPSACLRQALVVRLASRARTTPRPRTGEWRHALVGHDVQSRHYIKDDPSFSHLLPATFALERVINADCPDGLIIASSVRCTTGSQRLLAPHAERIDAALIAAGWLRQPAGQGDATLCDSAAAASLLARGRSTMRKWMRNHPDVVVVNGQRYLPLEVVLAERARIRGLRTLGDIAADWECDYHRLHYWVKHHKLATQSVDHSVHVPAETETRLRELLDVNRTGFNAHLVMCVRPPGGGR